MGKNKEDVLCPNVTVECSFTVSQDLKDYMMKTFNEHLTKVNSNSSSTDGHFKCVCHISLDNKLIEIIKEGD